MNKYCSTCKKETTHRKLKTLGFLGQCIVAIGTGFKTDLREPEYECNKCGKQS